MINKILVLITLLFALAERSYSQKKDTSWIQIDTIIELKILDTSKIDTIVFIYKNTDFVIGTSSKILREQFNRRYQTKEYKAIDSLIKNNKLLNGNEQVFSKSKIGSILNNGNCFIFWGEKQIKALRIVVMGLDEHTRYSFYFVEEKYLIFDEHFHFE